MHADPDAERISRAAATVRQWVSSFVLSAALYEADIVLVRSDPTLMPAEQFDVLINSLDTPDEAPHLMRIAAQHRRRLTR
jgi:uncharacterized protein (DUF1778 family)